MPAADMAQSIAAFSRLRSPSAKGVQAMLPHVDELRPIHNLQSMRRTGARHCQGAPAKGYDPKQMLKNVA